MRLRFALSPVSTCVITTLVVVNAALASPVEVTLYVDSAPDVYGSPGFAPWWSAAKTDVDGGTFTDMRNGIFPGTHTLHPSDEIVYS